jgi:D-beta-D-heptose 7-phosphate kinase/D-beta-D-heptose 1-phosphate adenosyltransferase
MKKAKKNRIIWTNGCFDIIHPGHIELFKYAKSKGDLLFVGIDTDSRVKELKGESRPINTQDDRKKVLEAIRYIDKVFLFSSTEEMECILVETGVDVIVIGDEYIGRKVTGEGLCVVDFFKKIPGKSTTSIIEKF